MPVGLVPKPVTSVKEAADAGDAGTSVVVTTRAARIAATEASSWRQCLLMNGSLAGGDGDGAGGLILIGPKRNKHVSAITTLNMCSLWQSIFEEAH